MTTLLILNPFTYKASCLFYTGLSVFEF